jgi:low affinity Fe/Cu permease
LAAVVAWALSGPVFGYSEAWQLTINTGTTIVTFLMVFIIQNSQNRESRALQVKIDELIRATSGADNALIDLEELSPTEITELYRRYCRIADAAKRLGAEFANGTPALDAEPLAERIMDSAEAAERTIRQLSSPKERGSRHAKRSEDA